MDLLLDAAATAARLPWSALLQELEAVLRAPQITVPPRLVQPLAGGGSLFVMPALDDRVAITKLITFTPANVGSARPTIQGDVVVFDIASGERRLVLDGPTVTARRTAAVSLLAALRLAPRALAGPLLVVGAGVQGRAHLEAFASQGRLAQVFIASRSEGSARALAEHARTLGLQAQVVPDAQEALAECPLAVTCTPAAAIALHGQPRPDAFLAAVGAFTPRMAEVAPDMCRWFLAEGGVLVDTRDADHEAGDLLQAGIDVPACPTLGDIVRGEVAAPAGPVLFKNCGWGGWDLAAARAALAAAA